MKRFFNSKLLYFFVTLSILFSCSFISKASDVEAISETDNTLTTTNQTFKLTSSDLYKFDTDIKITEQNHISEGFSEIKCVKPLEQDLA